MGSATVNAKFTSFIAFFHIHTLDSLAYILRPKKQTFFRYSERRPHGDNETIQVKERQERQERRNTGYSKKPDFTQWQVSFSQVFSHGEGRSEWDGGYIYTSPLRQVSFTNANHPLHNSETITWYKSQLTFLHHSAPDISTLFRGDSPSSGHKIFQEFLDDPSRAYTHPDRLSSNWESSG